MKKYFASFFVLCLVFVGNVHALDAKTASAAVTIYGPVDAPMVFQARGADWRDSRLADGCEEASIEMAHDWVRGIPADYSAARADIIAMSDYEKENFGFFEDTSADDTAELLTFFYHDTAYVQKDISVEDIKGALLRGELVLVPIDGRKIGYYRRGPPRHTIVVKGYNQANNTFIINDPVVGTKTVRSARLQVALRDYNSGVHLPVYGKITAMVRVLR